MATLFGRGGQDTIKSRNVYVECRVKCCDLCDRCLTSSLSLPLFIALELLTDRTQNTAAAAARQQLYVQETLSCGDNDGYNPTITYLLRTT